jgi:hypothetical protein
MLSAIGWSRLSTMGTNAIGFGVLTIVTIAAARALVNRYRARTVLVASSIAAADRLHIVAALAADE